MTVDQWSDTMPLAMEATAKGIVSNHWSLHCIYDSNVDCSINL